MRFVCWVSVLVLFSGCGSDTPAEPDSISQEQESPSASAEVATTGNTAAEASPATESEEVSDADAAEAQSPARPMPAVDPAFVDAALQTDEGIQLSAEEWMARADDLLSARDLRGAGQALNRALAADPELVDAYIKRAGVLAELGMSSQAIADMSEAIERRPDDARLHNTRGYFYLAQSNFTRATRDFNDAIGIDLEFAQPYNNRGLARIAQGDFETAVRDLDAALELDPEYHDAHNNRGLALMQLERFTEAIEAFSTAIELKPEYSGSWNNRGLAQHRAGEHAAAIEDFSHAIEMQPEALKFWMHRSVAREASGDSSGAEEDLAHAVWLRKLAELTQSLRQSPSSAERWVARGRHYLEKDELDSALQDFDRAVILDVSCAGAYSGRAAIYLRQGDTERAVRECTRAIERAPYHEAYSLRGDAHFERGDYDQAIEDYVAARRLDGQVAQAYLKRSQEHEAAGEIEQASADLEQAISLDPELAEEEQPSDTDSDENVAPPE